MRHKFQMILARAVKAQADSEAAKRKELEGSEDEDAKIDRELEETMKRMEKEKKRAAKKEKIAADKSELRKKMSVIATTIEGGNDEDLMMSRKLWDEVQKKGFEGVGERSDDDEDGSDGSDEASADEDDDSEVSDGVENESDSDSDELDEK